LGACGFCVDGIDTSEAAIAASRAAGGARFAVASLAGWTSSTLYDVVMSIDVLFHVLGDEEWAASLANLASLTRLGGQLIVTDEYRDDARFAGDYIVHRPAAAYARELGSRFEFISFTPYRFRDNQVGFFHYRRVG
jgi:2-polyprenyl-3-methyl-5-hydroxy-6-metoxy-1,4-benzoquinol methylase